MDAKDFQDFASLWSAVQLAYQGTDVASTIARLLYTYQPENGVGAYERLLKTLAVLLEDFHAHGRQLLMSMVPSPKGISREKVAETFYKATGSIRLDTSLLRYNTVMESIFSIEQSGSTNNNRLTRRNVNSSTKTSNFELASKDRADMPKIPSSSEVFRGFPPNEVSNVNAHVKNILPGAKPRWFQSHVLRKNDAYQVVASYQECFFKTGNKYLCLPVAKFDSNQTCQQSGLPHVSQAVYQNSFGKNSCSNESMDKMYGNEVLDFCVRNVDSSKLEMKSNSWFLHTDDESLESKKFVNVGFINKECPDAEILKSLEEINAKQHTVREDIHKMDIVCEDNENLTIETQDNLIMHDNLKTCLQNFLDRAKQEVSIEKPMEKRLPRNFERTRKTKDEVSNTSGCQDRDVAQLDVQNSLHFGNFCTGNESGNRSDIESPLYRYTKAEQSDGNFVQQTEAINLAAYKKQYYDTLLSIQRVKNSADVSTENSVGCNARCSNYSCQYQQLLHQQEQLTNPRLHTVTQPGLSMHNIPYTLMRCNDLRHLLRKPLRFQQQSVSACHKSQSWHPHCNRTTDFQYYMQNGQMQTGQCVQRRKLEDMFGKLKEMEDNGVND